MVSQQQVTNSDWVMILGNLIVINEEQQEVDAVAGDDLKLFEFDKDIEKSAHELGSTNQFLLCLSAL